MMLIANQTVEAASDGKSIDSDIDYVGALEQVYLAAEELVNSTDDDGSSYRADLVTRVTEAKKFFEADSGEEDGDV
jgi:hypothetical protein